MINDRQKIIQIWEQDRIPVIVRKGTGFPLMLRLPYQENNRAWLKGDRARNPLWIKGKKYWECPKAWFNDLVNKCLKRWAKVYIIQPYREQEICAPACQNAVGHECQCSCLGTHHGSGNAANDWFVVSDGFAIRWHDAELACRLLTIDSKIK